MKDKLNGEPIVRKEFKVCKDCAWPDSCKYHNNCLMEIVDEQIDLANTQRRLRLWALGSITILVIVVILGLLLSSRPAGASHGPVGEVISDRSCGVNRASGTSYRLVALAFQPYRYTSVFEVGTQEIDYILQWPQLPTVAEQYIRIARQRLATLMVEDRTEREAVRLKIDTEHTIKALGMACLFGGLMILIVVLGRKKD